MPTGQYACLRQIRCIAERCRLQPYPLILYNRRPYKIIFVYLCHIAKIYSMQLYYAPDIERDNELPEAESQHCIKVMRLGIGDEICATDGNGFLYKAKISSTSGKRCKVEIFEKSQPGKGRDYGLEIAIAPTKNNDRTEWFVEKSTEVGIDKIDFIKCRFSERKEIKCDRMEKIAVAAMKQSLKLYKPELTEMTDFCNMINAPFNGQKFIAHCHPGDKKALKEVCLPGTNTLILIGPEGDFSKEEVELAKKAGFIEVTLGSSRLRTETAAVVACVTVQIINEK